MYIYVRMVTRMAVKSVILFQIILCISHLLLGIALKLKCLSPTFIKPQVTVKVVNPGTA